MSTFEGLELYPLHCKDTYFNLKRLKLKLPRFQAVIVGYNG